KVINGSMSDAWVKAVTVLFPYDKFTRYVGDRFGRRESELDEQLRQQQQQQQVIILGSMHVCSYYKLLNYIPHRKVLMIYPYRGLNTQLYSISTSTAEGTKNLSLFYRDIEIFL
ncbi:hypothetical protein ACJX0J_025397, partial [Zea mays]